MGKTHNLCTAIDRDDIEAFRNAFESDSRLRASENAVTKTNLKSVAMNRRAVVRANHTFSHTVQAGAATSQSSSGRCWLFAGLNLFRIPAAAKMNIEDFELSQTYLFFFDKLEKANFFLENILSTLDEPTDSRLISWLLQSPVQDGGQWDMFVNLVEKYGVVPKEAMPETESSGSSGILNDRLTNKLREDASLLRKAHRAGEPEPELRRIKGEMLSEIYRVLRIHLGEPPREFLWQWRDKDKQFHRDGVLTPHEFKDRYVSASLDDLTCLIHCPTLELDRLYTIDYLGNVVGGRIIRYVNVDIDVLKRAVIAQIKDERSVWFGCDVGKEFDRDLGLMDTDLFEYSGVYGLEFGMDKATRIDYGASQMTHAMVFTGVDLDDAGAPRKWRVENSWGEKVGEKGFLIMTDAWFEQYTYEVVVDKGYLAPKLLDILETKPIALPPWHPMGSLAASGRG